MKKIDHENHTKNHVGLSIRLLLILSYTIVALIAILLVAVMTYSQNSSTMTNKVGVLATAVNDQIRLSVNAHFEDIEDICALTFSDSSVYEFYNTDTSIEDYDKIQQRKAIETMLIENGLMDNFGDLAIIYEDNVSAGKLSGTTSSLLGADTLYKSAFAHITEDTTLDGWFVGEDDYYSRIYYVKQINEHAVLLASIYSADLGSMMEYSEQIEDMTLRIVNDKNHIVYSTADNEVGTALDSNLTDKISSKEHATFIEGANLVTVNTCGRNWKLVSTLPTESILKELSDLKIYTVMWALVAIVIAIIIGFIFSAAITKPIHKIVKMMGQAEQGDLTVSGEFATFGELTVLKRSFESMLIEIRQLMKDAFHVADEVEQEVEHINEMALSTKNISENVVTAMEEIAMGSQRQLEESQDTFESLESLADSINNTMTTVQDTTHASQTSKSIGEYSKKQIEELRVTTKVSQETLDKMSGKFENLVDEIHSIEDILSVIYSISNETELLALNASIEAAKAGEHGRGFSVVADSVSTLAAQTTESTNTINAVLNNIKKYMQETIHIIDDTKAVFNEQVKMVDETIDSFDKIMESTDDISKRVGNIESIADNMISLKEATLSSTQTILEITETASSNTEEVLSVTTEELETCRILSEKSQALKEAVIILKSALSKFTIE